MADRTKRKTKKKKKVKVSSKGGTTVNVNVSMSVGARQQPKERVKRIRSRRRPNLREMRQSMPGAGGSRAFANPAFYGNVQMLTNSAMNQFQNQRYSLENQLRESRAEQKALLTAGRAEAAQNQGRETATLQTQLADTIKMFTGVTAQLAQGKGQLEGVAAEKEQQRQEQETQRGQAAGVERLTDVQLKEQIAPILAQSYPGFTPQGIKSSKFTETKGLMRKVLAYDDAEDKAALIKAFSRTARAKQSAEPQDPEISGEGESLYFSDDPSMELGDQDM